MKKVLIGVLIAVVIVAAAGAGYMLFVKKDDAASTTSGATAKTETVDPNTFSPVSTEGQPFVATITSTSENGKESVAVMRFDGEGNSEYELEAAGTTTRIVYTKEAYYTCSKDKCMKFVIKNGERTDVDPDAYEVTQEDIDNAKAGATNEGQEACGNSTCDVWSSTGFGQDGKAKIYVDTQTRRIVKIESTTADGVTTSMVYEYEPVTIEIPQNAQELPAGI